MVVATVAGKKVAKCNHLAAVWSSDSGPETGSNDQRPLQEKKKGFLLFDSLILTCATDSRYFFSHFLQERKVILRLERKHERQIVNWDSKREK